MEVVLQRKVWILERPLEEMSETMERQDRIQVKSQVTTDPEMKKMVEGVAEDRRAHRKMAAESRRRRGDGGV